MTDKPTPTDAELKAMWQLHAADIGGIFCYARAVLAKWGQPAQAAEPVARLVIGKTKGGVSLTHMVVPAAYQLQEGVYALYTAPQPVAREPLTRNQVKAILVESGYYNADAQHKSHFMNGIRHGEAAHGIKHGGQHGAE